MWKLLSKAFWSAAWWPQAGSEDLDPFAGICETTVVGPVDVRTVIASIGVRTLTAGIQVRVVTHQCECECE